MKKYLILNVILCVFQATESLYYPQKYDLTNIGLKPGTEKYLKNCKDIVFSGWLFAINCGQGFFQEKLNPNDKTNSENILYIFDLPSLLNET